MGAMAIPLKSSILTALSGFDRSKSKLLGIGGPLASITFDDFPSSAYQVGGPLLTSLGMRGTYFVSGSRIGQTISGIAYGSREEIAHAHEAGHEIACHGYEHRAFSRSSNLEISHSITQNLSLMRSILGDEFMPQSFAYPYGSVTPYGKKFVASRFAYARGTRVGMNGGHVDMAQLRVISLESYRWNPQALQAIIADSKRAPSWLIFLTHDIAESPSPYGTTPAVLHTVLCALKQADIPVLTLCEAGLRALKVGAAEKSSLPSIRAP